MPPRMAHDLILRAPRQLLLPSEAVEVPDLSQWPSVVRTGGLRAMLGWAAGQEGFEMAYKPLRHCRFTAADFCK